MTSKRLRVIDTTLREGEQFHRAFLTRAQRLWLAQKLDAFGIDAIELPSPAVSPGALDEIRQVAGLGLRAEVLVHCRCNPQDYRPAMEAGAGGVNLFLGTSPALRLNSHGRDGRELLRLVAECVREIRSAGLKVRFSAEDAFRSEPEVLFRAFDAAVEAGAHRLGLPDTVGVATPRQVFEVVAAVAERYPGVELEFHGHNDTGCAVANAYAAFEAGASCIDVTLMGIGERTGITPLSGFIARLYTVRPELLAPYDLKLLPELERQLASWLGIQVPFNLPITSPTAFVHRAGVHAKAVSRSPSSYEVLRPEDFGLQRTVDIAHRLTGRAALARRAAELGLCLAPKDLEGLTLWVKATAENRPMSLEEIDTRIRSLCYGNLERGDLQPQAR